MRTITVITRLSIVAATIGLLLAVAGCGNNLDTKKAEGWLKKSIVEQTSVAVTSVGCPRNVAMKKGGVFTCTIRGADGTSAPAHVTQKDGEGNVTFEARLVDENRVETAIGSYVQRVAKQPLRSVNCPDVVAIRKGFSYSCLVTAVSGDTVKATVVLKNNKGLFGFSISAK